MENIEILVPLDFSNLSTRGLTAAQRFAKLFDGIITPFHAYLPVSEMEGPYMLGVGTTPTEDYEEIEQTLQERLNEIARQYVDASYLNEAVISVGNAAHAIVEEGKEHDMIVMSTHGRTGFTRFFLGSVAEKVLRIAHVPVMVVDKESELGPIKKILTTTDFSENSHAAFTIVKEIAKAADANVELLNVISYDPQHDEEPDQNKINLRKKRLEILSKEEFHDISDRLHTNVIISTDTPHETILNRNLNDPADLIVMATVGRTGIEYLMMGSTTANVVRHVKTPVLSVNPKNKDELDEEV